MKTPQDEELIPILSKCLYSQILGVFSFLTDRFDCIDTYLGLVSILRLGVFSLLTDRFDCIDTYLGLVSILRLGNISVNNENTPRRRIDTNPK
jgi:hypothetical protein